MFLPVPGHCLLVASFISATLNLFIISEVHSDSDNISFQNVYVHRQSVRLWIRGMLVAYCVCDFLFYGYPCMKQENMML